MRLDLDTCEEILLTLTRNKTRSLLTAFGVFWGIFMLVCLIGGGRGMKARMAAEFDGFATSSAFVIARNTNEAYRGFQKGRKWNLEWSDVERVSLIPGVRLATAMHMKSSQTVVHGDRKEDCSIKGLTPDYDQIERQDMAYGRFINEVDLRESRKVCVIGERIYRSLFRAGEDPCGRQVRVGGIYYQVVGVTVSADNISIGSNASETVILPLTTMNKTYNTGQRVDIICLLADEGKHISDVSQEVERRVKAAHYISPTDRQAVMLLDIESLFTMMDNLLSGIDILVWMVGLGTLLAGAIGVSNIMMVTVRERTVEIGIRRAIGARPRDILQQIMAESVVLTAAAGLAGISVAVFSLHVLETQVNATATTPVSFQVPFWLAIGTTLLLLLLGVLAGLAPAFRAMAIKPIEAIRDE